MNKKTENNAEENKIASDKKTQALFAIEKRKIILKRKNNLAGKRTSIDNYSKDKFIEKLKSATEGLNYISETDADIIPFIGENFGEVNSKNLLLQIGEDLDSPVEEREFEGFFQHITKIQDWFDEEREQMAKRFQMLEDLLKDNLSDLKVINVGQIEIDVYVIGKDPENNLMGIKTNAVET